MHGNHNCLKHVAYKELDSKFAEGLRSPESAQKLAKPLPYCKHVLMKCGFICTDCRASSRSEQAFASFRCRRNAVHRKVVAMAYMCANCDALSNDIESFKKERCTQRTMRFPDQGPPPYVPPEPEPRAANDLKPSSTAASTELETKATPSNEVPKPTPSNEVPKHTPSNEAPKLKLSPRRQLELQLIEAQAHLDQLVIWQSLETEREHLQQLLLQKQKQEQAPTSTPSI